MGSAGTLNLLDRTATDSRNAIVDRKNNVKKALYFFLEAWHDGNNSQNDQSQNDQSQNDQSQNDLSQNDLSQNDENQNRRHMGHMDNR